MQDACMQESFAAAPAHRRLDAYAPIARAIDFLVAHASDHPSLEDAAAEIGMSPAHFQRVFKAGAGVSPKRFLQYLAANDAKRALSSGENVLEASMASGLSGPSRLHDLFLVAEAMTPGAYRRKGEGETIQYAAVDSPFGATLMGATQKGVCWLSFLGEGSVDDQISEMMQEWPAAGFAENPEAIRPLAMRAFAFAAGGRIDAPLGLHVAGTNFQLKVWEALLRIPFGETCTYQALAHMIGAPKAARAVGAAVGANMVSVLIPCHRVILASGVIHRYRWGAARKKALLAFEQASQR